MGDTAETAGRRTTPGPCVGAPRPTGRTERRRIAALAGLLGWAATFFLLPALHQLRHRDDHLHLASGAVLFLGTEPPGHAHPHPHAAPEALAPADAHAHLELPQGSTPTGPSNPFAHGEGALAHLGGATLPAPLTLASLAAPRVLEAMASAERLSAPAPRVPHGPRTSRGPPHA